MGDIPLAVIDQRPDGGLAGVAYIETDFTNTPALEDPGGDGAKTVFNLRYPGQYYDAFSGLHYNHTRYFSPAPAATCNPT